VTLSDKIDLKEIERKALTAYNEDGLLDIFWGGYFLFLGLSAFIQMEHRLTLGEYVLVIMPLSLGTFLYDRAKKRVTYPRLGYVKLTKEMEARILRDTAIVIFVAGFVTLTGLFTNMGVPEHASWLVLFLNKYNLLFQGGVLALIFLMLGRIMSISRLYYYSVISLLVFSAGYFYLDSPYIVSLQNLGVPCAIIGLIMVGIGASRLQRFIGKYSKEA
jgi:hypothetical protein